MELFFVSKSETENGKLVFGLAVLNDVVFKFRSKHGL